MCSGRRRTAGGLRERFQGSVWIGGRIADRRLFDMRRWNGSKSWARRWILPRVAGATLKTCIAAAAAPSKMCSVDGDSR